MLGFLARHDPDGYPVAIRIVIPLLVVPGFSRLRGEPIRAEDGEGKERIEIKIRQKGKEIDKEGLGQKDQQAVQHRLHLSLLYVS